MNTDNRDYRNYNEEKNKRFKGIFYMTVSIITLIVAIIGASFSYFIASASSADGAIKTQTTGFSIDYKDDYANIFNTDLVPSSSNTSLYAAVAQEYDASLQEQYQADPSAENKNLLRNKRCRDDNGNAVCSIYQFTVTNPANMGVAQTLNFSLKPTTNDFENLYIMVYDPNDEKVKGYDTAASRGEAGVVLDEYHLNRDNMTGDSYNLENLKVTLQPGEFKTYVMVIYILNKEDSAPGVGDGDQTEEDSNKSFAAAMEIRPDGQTASQIYGVIGASSGKFGG